MCLSPGMCPTGKSKARRPNALSSPLAKNILIFRIGKSAVYSRRLVPMRGALAIVTNAGRDAVDAGGATDERIELSWRTAKTWGPDAPTLASSLRINPRNDGGKKADHRGEHGISRKPSRAGMPGDSGGSL